LSQADWDVFFSYPRADYPLAEPLIKALRERGLRTFVDRTHVRDFSSISGALATSLSRSTLLLAFYSERYLHRRSCNFELTAAFVAGQREGDPCRRIAVVNPHLTFDHVHPTELRDRRSLTLYDYNDRLSELADVIEGHVRSIGGVIGSAPDAAATPWYPPPPRVGSVDTQPFRAELWATHSALRPGAAAYHTGAWEGGTARICALDQRTATSFAQDYALQFSAAYPGGIFWFATDGSSPDGSPASGYAGYLSTICDLLNVRAPVDEDLALRLAGVAAHLERSNGPSLWVVDGLRASHGRESLTQLRNPHSRGSTLFTGDVSRAEGVGSLIDLAFPGVDGVRPVLLHDAPPVMGSRPGQEEFADRIIRAVGGHPAALYAAKRLLTMADPPDLAYEFVHRSLGDPHEDVLAFDGRYAQVLDGLARDIGALREYARAPVLWASFGEDCSVPIDTVVRALSLLRGTGAACPVGPGIVAELGQEPYVQLTPGRLHVHPLVARAVRYRLDEPGLVDELARVWEKAKS
jgi:hypothetical protein